MELEARALVSDVRKAVLALRAAKGMLLDSNDHDTWSAGSFFANPILSAEVAASLPADAPRWIQDDGRVKTSAAWLMEHAGVKKGQIHNGAGVSSKHVLALVNTGSATAADIVDILVYIVDCIVHTLFLLLSRCSGFLRRTFFRRF